MMSPLSVFMVPFAVSLPLLAGCGPATPADSPAPTASAEAAPAPTASADAMPTASAEAAPAPTASAEAKPPEPPPPPNVTATLGGKEFKPRSAITAGELYQGRVLIALADYDASCGSAAKVKEGDRTLAMQIEWKQGEVAFAGGKDKKKDPSDPFYTIALKDNKLKEVPFVSKGKVELAGAPTEVGKSTRLKLDLTSGKDSVKGDIELFVCWEIKDDKKK